MDSIQKIKARFNRLLKIAAKGLALTNVSDEESKRRYNICKNDCNNYDAKSDKCIFCGCFMEVKSKTLTHINPKKGRTEVTHCPAGLWNDKDIANYYRLIDGLTKIQ
jgi:hypothetical protein